MGEGEGATRLRRLLRRLNEQLLRPSHRPKCQARAVFGRTPAGLWQVWSPWKRYSLGYAGQLLVFNRLASKILEGRQCLPRDDS